MNAGEYFAKKFLSNIFEEIYFIDGRLDFKVVDRFGKEYYIEVKSCNEVIFDNGCAYGTRAGRFWITKKQLEYLRKKNGYIMFIVFGLGYLTKVRLMHIDEFYKEFGDYIKERENYILLNWRKVFHHEFARKGISQLFKN